MSIDRDYEAASGDLLENDDEPIFIMRVADGKDVITALGRCIDGVFDIRYQIVEDGIQDVQACEMFYICYFTTFTMHHWRGEAQSIRFENTDSGTVATAPYPSGPEALALTFDPQGQ